jgi:hypothetical protein
MGGREESETRLALFSVGWFDVRPCLRGGLQKSRSLAVSVVIATGGGVGSFGPAPEGGHRESGGSKTRPRSPSREGMGWIDLLFAGVFDVRPCLRGGLQKVRSRFAVRT